MSIDHNKYDIDMKKRLVERIASIREKKTLIMIWMIIKKNNPNISMTENSNGIFVKFNDLTNATYEQIDEYLKKHYIVKNHNNLQLLKLTKSDSYTDNNNTNNSNNTFNSEYKLSNKEKTLINGKKM
jgi:hypothetical protein